MLALSDDTADNVHACGSFAHCRTGQVEFISGEPQTCTPAEFDVLERKNKLGEFRLACQSPVNEDMLVRVLMEFRESGRSDSGQRPENQLTPNPEWIQ